MMNLDFKDRRKRQWILALGISGFVMAIGCIYVVVSSLNKETFHNTEIKTSLITGGSRINPQEAWVYQFREEADLHRKRIDLLEEMLKKMMTQLQKMTEDPKKDVSEKPQEVSEKISEEIKTVRQELKAISTTPIQENKLPPLPGSFESNPIKETPSFPMAMEMSPTFRSKSVRKIALSLKNSRVNNPLKTSDNTIPAGAFARAVLLGGVDASSSIQASGDPRPALLRLTDEGTLPRQFRSDVKGCHVLVACYGDISSERVMMRLEKLTCTERKTGEIIEVNVQGYVAGEDGRTGVRGTVVDRAGTSMRNAMVGGFVSGISDFLSQSRNSFAVAPLTGLAQMAPLGIADALKQGAGQGVGQALDKYADFYIKRAEQIQPVIQVAAGRAVDIVFTEGVSISETQYRQATSRTNDQNRYLKMAETVHDLKGEMR